jgi:hypothetical protein
MTFENEIVVIAMTLILPVIGWFAGWHFGYSKGRDEGFKVAIELLQDEQAMRESFDL